MNKNFWRFGRREIILAIIGAGLFGLLSWATNFLEIPDSKYVAVQPAVAIPMFFSVAFGPIVGFIAGFLGNIISDLLTGYGIRFWWDLGNGIQGLLPGLIWLTIKDYKNIGNIVRVAIMVSLGIILGMGLASLSVIWIAGTDFATTVSIYFIPSLITNLIWGLILVPLLMIAYSAVQSKSGRYTQTE